MKYWIRVSAENYIIERIDIDPRGRYHPDILWILYEPADSVPPQEGDIYVNGTLFSRPPYGMYFDETTLIWIIDTHAQKKDEAIETLPESIEAQTIVVGRLMNVMNGITTKITDTEITVVAAGFPNSFHDWSAPTKFTKGQWIWWHETNDPAKDMVLYEVMQEHTSQAHQPPGSTGMLAVYRPVDPAKGTEDDPKTLILGMDALTGLYYKWDGFVWKCLRDLIPTFEGRQPGAPGMETYWQKIRAV